MVFPVAVNAHAAVGAYDIVIVVKSKCYIIKSGVSLGSCKLGKSIGLVGIYIQKLVFIAVGSPLIYDIAFRILYCELCARNALAVRIDLFDEYRLERCA